LPAGWLEAGVCCAGTDLDPDARMLILYYKCN